MIVASIVLGISMIASALIVSSGLDAVRDGLRDVGHDIHILAETFNEIKHQGIGIDDKVKM